MKHQNFPLLQHVELKRISASFTVAFQIPTWSGLFSMLLFLLATFNLQPAHAQCVTHTGNTWYVNDASTAGDTYTSAVGASGGIGTSDCPFLTVAAAISAAAAGDTIMVDAGTYTGGVTVDKRLDIRGAGNSTIIQNTGGVAVTYAAAGSGSSSSSRTYLRNVKINNASRGLLATGLVNYITLDGVTFDGITTGSNTGYAIHLNNTSGVMNDWAITNCIFNANNDGFRMGMAANVDGLSITNNTFTSQTGYGVYIPQQASPKGGCTNATITGNTFTSNGSSNNMGGVYIEKMNNGTISSNTFTNNGTSVNPRGIIVNLKYNNYSNLTISNNAFTENRGGSQLNSINGYGGYAIYLAARNDASSYTAVPASLSNATVSSNNISGFYAGIGVANAVDWNNTAIENNSITGSTNGIYAELYGTGNTANNGKTLNIHNNSISASGYLILNLTNGSVDASCNWYGSINANTIASKISGNVTYSPYYLAGTDGDAAIGFQPSGSCTGTPVTIAVASSTNVSCFGGSNGAIDVTASGGATPYSYSWSNSSTTEDANGLSAGTFTVTVTDANGSTAAVSRTLTQPTQLTATASGTDVTCYGGSNGSIDLTVGGGTTSYSYSWSNGSTTEDLSGLTANTYTVTVTDANGCTISTSAAITQPAAVIAGITNNTGTTVLTCATTSISLTATGGSSYSWSDGSSVIGTNPSLSRTSAGTYTVTVTGSNGCTATSATTITSNTTLPTAGITNNSGTTLLTCLAPSISLTATGGETYSWSGGLGNSAAASVTASGTYSVTATAANGCTATSSITITSNQVTLSLSGTNTVGSCSNNTSTVRVFVTGGAPPYTASSYFANNGDCTYTVTDSMGCQVSTVIAR